MKKVIIIILLFLAFTKVDGQLLLSPNLVANPSFEFYTLCPDNSAQIPRAYPWSDCLGGNGSSEYFNTCTNIVWMLQFLNMQQPRSGNGEAGIAMYGSGINHDYREYIMGILIDSLNYNKRYCGEFYTSLDNYSFGAVENMGMYFSVDTVLGFPNAHGLYHLQPQIENHNGIITDTANWVRVYGSFVASGEEKHVTIGNFTNNINTNYQTVNYGAVSPYYLIDDVSVCECSFQFNLGNDTTLCNGNSLLLNPNIPNAIYTWQDSSHASTYNVTQAGTYWLRAYFPDYNISTSDTINIGYVSVPIVNLGNDTTLCNGQSLLLNATYINCTYYWQDGTTQPTYTATQTGVYIVKVTDTTTNCSSTSQIKLECELDPEIPNVFTPNEDGFNDYFFIKNIEYWNIDVQIFNRWGNIIYQNNTYKNTWDGKDVSDGVYYYIIKATNNNSGLKKEYKGSVTVLR